MFISRFCLKVPPQVSFWISRWFHSEVVLRVRLWLVHQCPLAQESMQNVEWHIGLDQTFGGLRVLCSLEFLFSATISDKLKKNFESNCVAMWCRKKVNVTRRKKTECKHFNLGSLDIQTTKKTCYEECWNQNDDVVPSANGAGSGFAWEVIVPGYVLAKLWNSNQIERVLM